MLERAIESKTYIKYLYFPSLSLSIRYLALILWPRVGIFANQFVLWFARILQPPNH
jgi:hypothetical protein